MDRREPPDDSGASPGTSWASCARTRQEVRDDHVDRAGAPEVTGCPVDESFDPLSAEFLADPYVVMARRPGGGAPVFFAPSIGYYVVARYEAVEQVFRDPATYSAAVAQAPLVPIVPEAQGILLGGGYKPQPTMVSLDEPEHARLRKPAARASGLTPLRLDLAIPGRSRGHQVGEQVLGRVRDALDRVLEGSLVGPRRLLHPGHLAHVLERGGLDLVGSRRRLEVVKRFDVSTHRPSLTTTVPPATQPPR